MTIQTDSLVLYKDKPACVKQVGDKLEIRTERGKTVKVRSKDVTLIHPGPVQSLAALKPPSGDVETAWELLDGQETNLVELAELVYDEYTPASAWAAWQLVAEGVYFRGTVESISVRTATQIAQEQAAKAAKLAEQQARHESLNRLKAGHYLPDDDFHALKDIEALALSKRDRCHLLKELGQEETPEQAHALLLKLGYWQETVNPYPVRLAVEPESPRVDLPPLPDEARVDLTHLPAFAIDDEDSRDPDDAISLDGSRLWVHVADAAALVSPNSPLDLEARHRGSTLYLPERTITMLPPAVTPILALGLQETSPALSFGLDLDSAGEITHVEVVRSWVRVTRLTYPEVDRRIEEEAFNPLYHLARRNEARRVAQGAVQLDLPEVKVRVVDDEIIIRPLPRLKSRQLVTEAMLMAGEATAKFALERDIPVPFSTQPPPDMEPDISEGLAGMFARRKTLKRSEMKSNPAPHSGLGLPAYAQATSPLRRYLDLVVHQQLRAHLRGEPVLDSQAVFERVGAADAVSGSVRQAERLSRRHWTWVYLQRHPAWQGEAVVVEKRDKRGKILIPALQIESNFRLPKEMPLNTVLQVKSTQVRLPELQGSFRVVSN